MENNSFTSGKILTPLLKFAGPVLLALFLQAMYGAVDLLVVGKFATTADVSGVSTGSQFTHLILALVAGFATGITVVMGQHIGEGNPKAASKALGAGVTFFLGLGIVLTALILLLVDPIVTFLNTPQEAVSQTRDYIFICSAGTLFIVAFNVLGSIFRGLGDSKVPLITVAIACVVNIFGDLFAVCVLHLGAAGAAYATVLAQGVSVALSLIIISRKNLPISLHLSDLKADLTELKNILQVGFPISLQDVLVSLSFMVILIIVNSLGLVASAGVGVAEKVCAFVMLLPSACSQSMSAFVAQNVGAEKHGRARKALWYGIAFSFCVSILVFYAAFFHGTLLTGIFSNEPDVIQAGSDYLKAYAIDCLMTSFLFCFIGYFSGYGKTKFVLIQGLIGAFGVRIPVSYLMSKQAVPSLFHVALATPCSTVVQIILCFIYLHILNQEIRNNFGGFCD